MTNKRQTPLQAIREKCLDCCCGSRSEVKLCPCNDCSLWLFRAGHNPARAGIGGKGNNAQNANSSPGFQVQDLFSDNFAEKAMKETEE